jgi:UDP-N-acetyl-D-mannosaminuronic acid dehydrogenase
MKKNKKICVIGLGYIGLPTAALIAKKGFCVAGVDINKKVVSTINQGKIHIIEPDLEKYVKSAISKGKLKAYNKVQRSDIYIICVPTPFHNSASLPKPNIDYVLSSITSIAPHVKSGDLIILESTSPVGTTQKISKVLKQLGVNLKNIDIAYCPERVLPGKIMKELVRNNRIVGGLSKKSTKAAVNFYRQFVKGVLYETNAKTAEMCKLTENSFRDTNIAFANEISMICDKLDINIWELIKLTNKHPRVNILQPGTGVGGHCIAVDPWFIVSQDKKNSKLIRRSREVNNYKTTWVINKIKDAASKFESENKTKPKIACLGLAFKPDIDDLRESTALTVCQTLIKKRYDISIVEPNIESYKGLLISNTLEAIKTSDIICILVKHKEFMEKKILNKLKKSQVLDFCGALKKYQ